MLRGVVETQTNGNKTNLQFPDVKLEYAAWNQVAAETEETISKMTKPAFNNFRATVLAGNAL
jgi:hypothetical protein